MSSNDLNRRQFAFNAMGLALTCGLSSQASAQTTWPNRPVQISLGFAPGSGADILARYFARKLEEKSGQGFVIVNREPTEQDEAAHLVLNAEIGPLMAETLALMRN